MGEGVMMATKIIILVDAIIISAILVMMVVASNRQATRIEDLASVVQGLEREVSMVTNENEATQR
jgi:cell division protein FtsL